MRAKHFKWDKVKEKRGEEVLSVSTREARRVHRRGLQLPDMHGRYQGGVPDRVAYVCRTVFFLLVAVGLGWAMAGAILKALAAK